jgi:DNA modification methylase
MGVRDLLSEGIICGDALTVLPRLPSDSIQLTVTSPPYYRQKDYGVETQIGWEATPAEYIDKIRSVLAQLLRITLDSGACFIVVGDKYVRGKLMLIPQRIALAADDVGWNVRSHIVWQKKDPPPESVKNRWRASHESVLFLTKQRTKYKFNADAIRQPYSAATLARWGKGQLYGGPKSEQRVNQDDTRIGHGKSFRLAADGCIPTDVWSVASSQSKQMHYGTYPRELIEPAVAACSDEGDWLLDPFAGSGTSLLVGMDGARNCVGIELNDEYANDAAIRLGVSVIPAPKCQ